MRFWRKKQTWKVIAALLFAVWILMGDRKINVKAESMETENFTGETAVETEEEITKKTTEKTVTAGIGYRAASADSDGITEQLVSDMSFEQVQALMDEMLEEDSFSIGTALKNMINGETVFSKEAVQQFLRSLFFDRLEKERANFFRILLLVLAAAVFSNFAEVFENSQIGEVSFYMVYLLLFTILMNSYQQLGVSLGKQLEWMTQFMKGLAPAYFVAVSAASGAVTASVFYQGVLLLVWLVESSLYGEPSFQRGYVKQDGRASGNYDQLEPENHAWGCPWASGGTRVGCACHGCYQTNCPGQNCRSDSGWGKCRKCGNRIDSGRGTACEKLSWSNGSGGSASCRSRTCDSLWSSIP